MPLHYGSILAEHRAVRERAGLFDVSHMGQIHLEGPGACEALERLLSCPVASLRPGRARYGMLCNQAGGVVDDVTLYRLGAERFFLCVNAANIEKDWRWLARHCGAPQVQLQDRSADTALLALQGPAAGEIIARLLPDALPPLRRFQCAELRWRNAPLLLSRTGYTGADGFELYCPAQNGAALWQAILEAGAAHGALPCGLGARDTLRLEAALPLYGNELDDATSPLEAGLGRFVKLAAGGFVGAEAIRAQERRGLAKRLAGFELLVPGVARSGCAIAAEPAQSGGAQPQLGVVTSGAPSPSLGKSIGLGYFPPPLATPGSRFAVLVRGRPLAARVVETPFL